MPKNHSFFSGLKPEHMNFFTKCATPTNFKAGETIFKEGQEVDNLYLITDGLVSIEMRSVNKPLVLETLQANDVLGWSWLLPPYQAHFTCKAVKDTRVIALKGETLRQKCKEDHDLGYELLTRLIKVVTSRLEATRLQLFSIYGS